MPQFSVNIQGRVRNFNLPKNKPLIPLHEAVVNAIHAIDERHEETIDQFNGHIEIQIVRAYASPLPETIEDSSVTGFIIRDNGIGFNNKNIKSFAESDSEYKAKFGGKGVGRFSWLKAFRRVSIKSYFFESRLLYTRQFEFSLMHTEGVPDYYELAPEESELGTTVYLDTYINDYAKDVPKSIETIALQIVQHCLVYFLNENCPEIQIFDDANKKIVLNDLFRRIFKPEENSISFEFCNQQFALLNVKIQEQHFTDCNSLYLCANNRLVETRNLEKPIVNLDRRIFDENGFWYVGVLTGRYFDENVDMNRLSFCIPASKNLLSDSISIEGIVARACEEIEKYLEEYLTQISAEKKSRIEDYVTHVAPQYRHLLKRKMESINKIKPGLNDEKLDDELYQIKRAFENELKKEGKELIKKIGDGFEEYDQIFKEHVEKVSEANGAALADYVVHRRSIIDLFESGLRASIDGKFNKEKYMHNLIYPMRTTSDDLDYSCHNLWLIDEKLSYCHFISSDIPYDNDPKEDRSDLVVLEGPIAVSDDKNDGPAFDSIIIFELKRPMRDDYSVRENPIEQLLDYAMKIKEGRAKDKYHRPIKVGETTKFFMYAICDITDKLKTIAIRGNFSETPDKMGYFYFHAKLNAYIEILSYDKILLDAKKRNRVLFEKLGV